MIHCVSEIRRIELTMKPSGEENQERGVILRRQPKDPQVPD
jgi:hypothetical protein